MSVDNSLYNRTGDIWWDENEQLSMLKTMLNPARFGFFSRVLLDRMQINPGRRMVLDVGCGGGLLAEDFARLGLAVAGIDPSYPSLSTARTHAAQSNLAITYIGAAGELMPFADGTFDIVFCCDVLEHVAKPRDVILEIARVLKSDGIFLYDTINRTWRSWLGVIRVFQEWNWTSCAPTNLHDWAKFIKPSELRQMMASVRLENRLTVGIKPAANLIDLLRQMRKRKRGEISHGELGRRMKMAVSEDLSMSYMGYAVKTG